MHKYGVSMVLIISLLLCGCMNREGTAGRYPVILTSETQSIVVDDPNAEQDVWIDIDNQSDRDLEASNSIFLSYHIYDSNRKQVVWDGLKTPLHIRSGKKDAVRLQFEIPKGIEGEYILALDVLEENVTWFTYANGTDSLLDIPLTIKKAIVKTHLDETNALTEETLASQRAIDEQLRQELQSGEYTIENPLVVLDPYGLSPLTAVALFSTDSESKVSVLIEGESKEATIEHSFEEYSKDHMVPIYGLYAAKDNPVHIVVTSANGESVEKDLIIQTEELTDDLKNISLIAYCNDVDQYQSGLNFSYQSIDCKTIKMAFDINGDIRWYLSGDYGFVSNYNSLESIFVFVGRNRILWELSPLGRISNVYYCPYATHHEMTINKEKNTMLLTVSRDPEAEGTFEDLLVEMDLSTGELLTKIDYRDVIQRSRDCMVGFSTDVSDWMHMNSALEYQNNVIVSSNYQSAIISNTKQGEINWILGDPIDWLEPWKPFLLTPIGDDFEWPYNQHSISILPDYDNNPDTIDLLLFDNGYSRNVVNKELQKKVKLNQEVEPELYSRLVHYRIDEVNKTVEQIWEYGKERPELFSKWRGDAELLANGNILGDFNRERDTVEKGVLDTVYTEVNKNKEVVWECLGTSKLASDWYSDYKIDRADIYNQTAKELDVDAAVNNYININ